VLGVPEAGTRVHPEIDKRRLCPVVVIPTLFWRNRLHSAADRGAARFASWPDATIIVAHTPAEFNGGDAGHPRGSGFVPFTVPPRCAGIGRWHSAEARSAAFLVAESNGAGRHFEPGKPARHMTRTSWTNGDYQKILSYAARTKTRR